jgi:HEPN domain-containing protein
MDNKTTLVKNWLIKAIHDLAVSKKLKTDKEQYLDVAIYHCQQAAEKAIKGFLVLHDNYSVRDMLKSPRRICRFWTDLAMHCDGEV